MKSRNFVLLVSIFIFLVSIANASAKYSGGTGEPNDPYIITTAQDLIDLGNKPTDYDKHFIQDANIDMSEYIFEGAVIAWDTNPDDTDFQGAQFTGTFNGNGYIISNLYIQGKNCLGMFGQVSPEATLSNIALEKVYIQKQILLLDCTNVGALVGYNAGKIIKCYSESNIDVNSNTENTGGLVGYNSGDITLSYSTGIVSGHNYVGGLVGYNSGNITLSNNIGAVNGNAYIGGLAGYNSGNITSSYSTGDISGNYDIGGLVGRNEFNIISSYSTGSATGTNTYIGGLVGRNDRTITSSYSNGLVIGEGETGGLVGFNSSNISSSFWDTQTSGQSTSDGGTGLTTEQMKTTSTFSQWDCVGEQNNGTCDFWYIQEGDYPQLAVFSGYPLRELQGSGTSNDPYKIYDANDLGIVCYNPTVYYRLEADINLSDIIWRQPIVPYFNANFDGNWHTIKSFSIEGKNYLGLFGKVDSNAEISNLTLEDVIVNGSRYIGALAGENYGSIKSSYITGTVNGSTTIGGMVGINYSSIVSSSTVCQVNGNSNAGILTGINNGSITSCYCDGRIHGVYVFGGIVGKNNGSMNSSFSKSAIQIGREMIGGLVGDNSGSITACYYNGTISPEYHDYTGGLAGRNSGSITSSFWDIETSGIDISDGGIGKTTAEMQDINTYLNMGWDFVDEQNNGTCNFWCFEEGTYPQLAVFSGYAIQEPQGSGTPENPYLIYDINDLGTIWYYPQSYYSQVQDINLSDTKWNNSIVPWFAGNFNGNHYKISSLYIEGGGLLGFLGILDYNAEISNISLESGYINGTGDVVGGLVGSNTGNIISSSFKGKVSGHDYTGGLVGYNYPGNITSCFSIGEVVGNNYIGGLVGINGRDTFLKSYNESNINSSYSRCIVMGAQNVGGLIGENVRSCINSSYSSSKVNGQENIGGLIGRTNRRGQYIACFWDTETSGLSTSDGGTGKTTAEMQDIITFLNEGWDFIGETENGTEDIWWIDNGLDYPRLWWELDTNN